MHYKIELIITWRKVKYESVIWKCKLASLSNILRYSGIIFKRDCKGFTIKMMAIKGKCILILMYCIYDT